MGLTFRCLRGNCKLLLRRQGRLHSLVIWAPAVNDILNLVPGPDRVSCAPVIEDPQIHRSRSVSVFTRTAMLAPLAALAMLCAGSAAAETLIYVTTTTIGTVDSADPSADNTSSKNNSGPLNYTLPNGATVVGAHVSLEDNILYLLAVNNGTCQLYSANTSSSGSASVSPVDASYPCA